MSVFPQTPYGEIVMPDVMLLGDGGGGGLWEWLGHEGWILQNGIRFI